MKRFLIPLGGFFALAVFLALGLGHDPHEIPSPLIDRPAPAFDLPVLEAETSAPARLAAHFTARFAPRQLAGRVWLLNVWASWCVSCREEHPLLLAYARSPGAVPVIGLDYKDTPADAQSWLARLGNPYTAVASDADGRVGIDYGVYGVPETYLIDRSGKIRFKQIGPLTADVLRERLVPLIRELQR